jgi:predicted dehydrogenase
MNPKSRPEWFFHPKRYGGIITDIASHQFDQFLFFTGSKNVEVVSSQVANVNHPEYPELEDFADVLLKGDTASGYMRVDWFTPESLKTWGDTRLTVLGTEGYIEVRKNIDITGREGANHLFLVNNKETKYIDCKDVPLTYGHQLVDDVLNRTETALPQEHCFYAAELSIRAQQKAKRISYKN